MKIFQVTSKWTVFRIPIKNFDGSSMFRELEEWLEDNCSGTYKLFFISRGSRGQSKYGARVYGPLLEVDLLLDVDVVAFKLRWI